MKKVCEKLFNLYAIHPDRGERYSKNLYLWIKNHRSSHRRIFVYKHQDGDWYIGVIYDGDLLGNRLTEVICQGGQAKIWCMTGLEKSLTLIPDFWTLYQKIGKCAFDPEHGWYPERYEKTDETTRVCKWCGRVEHLHIERKVIETEVWTEKGE